MLLLFCACACAFCAQKGPGAQSIHTPSLFVVRSHKAVFCITLYMVKSTCVWFWTFLVVCAGLSVVAPYLIIKDIVLGKSDAVLFEETWFYALCRRKTYLC